jgi:hypothetical protein
VSRLGDDLVACLGDDLVACLGDELVACLGDDLAEGIIGELADMPASDIVITYPGAKYLIWSWRYALSTALMHLYINPHTPAETDLWTDYVPASFPGYSPIRLDEWSYPFTNDAGQAEIDAPVATFTQTGLPSVIQTVYGYAVVDSQLNLLYAERTELVGFQMAIAPLSYRVFPSMALGRIT